VSEGRKEGLKAALAATVGLGAPALPVADGPQQAELLPDAAPPRPVGRPTGSRNRRTQEWADFLLARHGRSPLEVLAEIAVTPTAELARELGCDRIDALDRRMRAAAELAPYLHQKQPVAVQTDGAPITPLVVQVTPGVAAKVGIPLAPPVIVESVADQGVSEAAP
jgi:hypothetical protein